MKTYSDVDIFNWLFSYEGTAFVDGWKIRPGRSIWELQRFLRITLNSMLTPEEKHREIISFFRDFAYAKIKQDSGMVKTGADPIKAINIGLQKWRKREYPLEGQLLRMLESPGISLPNPESLGADKLQDVKDSIDVIESAA